MCACAVGSGGGRIYDGQCTVCGARSLGHVLRRLLRYVPGITVCFHFQCSADHFHKIQRVVSSRMTSCAHYTDQHSPNTRRICATAFHPSAPAPPRSRACGCTTTIASQGDIFGRINVVQHPLIIRYRRKPSCAAYSNLSRTKCPRAVCTLQLLCATLT